MRYLYFSAILLLNASVALPVLAQSSAGSEDAEEVGAEDIIVTARRRNEAAQDVPIAISIINDKQLEATGSFNVSRLTQLQPSLTFYSTNPRNSAANIRGLGAPFGLTNDGIEQGVGLYVDQVYFSRIAAATFDFLDVERLEVLRGPQGTLYGKNTTAGAINLTTRAPSFEPEGRYEFTLGWLGFMQAKAALSGPLVADRLAARLAASITKRRGTIFNVTTGRSVNEQYNMGVRGQLLFTPNDRLSVIFAADYNRQNPDCCAQIYVRTGATQRPLNRQFSALSAAFNYAPPSQNAFDRLTDIDAPLKAKQTLGGVSLRAEMEVGEGKLTSITAWRFWDWDPSNDRDFTGLPITTLSQNPSKHNQYTQEFRYSREGEDVDIVLGLFGFRQQITTQGVQEHGAAASRWLLNPSSIAANDPATLNGLRSENDIFFKNDSVAVFGQLDWRLNEKLTLQPGLRVNYDRKFATYAATVQTGTGSNVLTSEQRSVLAPQSYAADFSDWNLSGGLTLSYKINKVAMVYGTYARSFKSGGINLSGLPLDSANNPILSAATVKPEKVDHFESGLKSQFFNRKLTFNLSAYWTEIADYQATVTNGQLGVLRGYLANADKVRVRGIETDLSWRLSRGLSFYANGAFTDARYVKFIDAPCPPELSGGPNATASNPPSLPGVPGGFSPANCDVSGQWLPGVSRWSASLGAEYSRPGMLLGEEGEAYAGLDVSARSRFSSNPSRSLYTDVDGYALTNLRIGFRTDRKWDAFMWLRNAFNTRYYEVLATQSGNTGLIVGQPGDQRTWGLTLKGQF